jgi:hypothetical protein
MMLLAHSPCPNPACAAYCSSAGDVSARHNFVLGDRSTNQSLPFNRACPLQAQPIAPLNLARPPYGSPPTHLDAARSPPKSP